LSIPRWLARLVKHARGSWKMLPLAACLTLELGRQALTHTLPPRWLFSIDAQGPWLFPLLLLATVMAVAVPIKIWNNTRTEMNLEQHQQLLLKARMAALTSQINPHFLFNTLNSVSSLIRTDPMQARVMIIRLSKVLRRLLRKHETFSPLRDELSFIEDYLAIEVVRFGEKLRFERDVAQDTLDMLVPSMLLQPLVENSIKHGLSSKVEGGTIRIRTWRTENRLFLIVEDDGVGIPEAILATLPGRGIGVNNVHERLKVLFANDYRMWIESQPGNGARIQIEVPELQPSLVNV
jgi:two-component system, LytTR family, sensor kinase